LRTDRLLLDLIDIPVALAITFAIAWALSSWLGRPLRRLTGATRQLASRRVPEPVSVPAGNDELAELARSFNAMAGAVRDHVEREQAFTRYASHELRTPLSAMRLQIERAETGMVPATDVLPALRRQVQRMEEILMALLTIARSEADEVQRPVADVVRDAVSQLPADARQRLSVRNAAPGDVEVRYARLAQQALANLVDNALRHGSGTTTLRVDSDDTSLTLLVQDAGPGVPDEDLVRLTEPFYRRGAGPGGSGLGLTLVSLIARSLRGSFTLHNTDPGMQAVLRLPIVVSRAR